MSDDISIPRPALPGTAPGRHSFTHSYRSRRSGMDGATKKLLLAASALVAVLVGGMTVWTFSGHHAAGVPTIEADARPLRVKPENPGGMTAIGVGEQMAASTGSGDLAPAAEQPDPQALLAQRREAAPPKLAPAAPLVSATVTEPASAAQAQAATPAPATPAPATPAPATPAPATPAPAMPVTPPAANSAARPSRPASGGLLVQLAALDSEAAATAEWQRLAHQLPELLAERHPVVQRTDQGGKAFWRLRTGGFTDTAEATQFCKRIRAKGIGCSLANF